MERLTRHASSVASFREQPVSGVSGIWHRRRAQYRGHIYQVDERAGLHLSHHLAAVCFHRDLADAELATSLFNRPETTGAMTSRSRRLSEA